MKNNVELELKVIEKFIHQDKRERYKQFVTSEKTRSKFIKDLAHFKFLEADKFDKIERNERNTILERLKELKKDFLLCYAISENPKLDTRTLETAFALDQTIGYGMGTILVFGDADIVFYEGEEASDRLLSR